MDARRIHTTDLLAAPPTRWENARLPVVGLTYPGRLTLASFHGQDQVVENLEGVTLAFDCPEVWLRIITQTADSSVQMRSLGDLVALSGGPFGYLYRRAATVSVDNVEWPAQAATSGPHQSLRFDYPVDGLELVVGVAGRGLSLDSLQFITIRDLSSLVPPSWTT